MRRAFLLARRRLVSSIPVLLIVIAVLFPVRSVMLSVSSLSPAPPTRFETSTELIPEISRSPDSVADATPPGPVEMPRSSAVVRPPEPLTTFSVVDVLPVVSVRTSPVLSALSAAVTLPPV